MLLVLWLNTTTIQAVNYSTSVSGSWTTGSNWVGGSSPAFNPTSNTANIVINHNITLISAFQLKGGTILTISSGDTLTVTGDVQFDNNGVLTINTGGVFIINGNVTNNNNSNDITINGTIVINGNFVGGNGSQINGTGNMDITGTVTTTGGTVFGSTVSCSTPGSCSSSFSNPLPIELINFIGKNIDEINLITWSTATETNNDFFTIEKSNNGIEYEIVGIVEGAGNSSAIKYYSLVDDNPYSKTYYRLKQTDYDGKYTYSKIIFIETVELDFEFEVFPNPNDGSNIYAKIKANKDQKILVVVNDVLGKQIYSKIIIYENEENVIYVIDPSEKLSSGIYMIIATSDNKIYSKKLIIK